MRRRRAEARTRVAIKAFLAGKVGAAETCLAISPARYWDPTFLSEDDKKLITVVTSETDHLPVGKLRDNWHPDFLPAKLQELTRYEVTIEKDVRDLCERLLEAMTLKAVRTKEQ